MAPNKNSSRNKILTNKTYLPDGSKVSNINSVLSNAKGKETYIKGKLKGKSKAYYQFESNQNQDIYLKLENLTKDVDIRIYTLENFQEGGYPFETSTESGVKDEAAFFKAKEDGRYIIEVGNNTSPTKGTNSKYELGILNLQAEDNTLLNFPNDIELDKQWYLFNGNTENIQKSIQSVLNFDIKAPEAWTIRTSSKGIPIAIIDSGIDYHHNDIKKNLWINKDEIPNNNKDDDKNGYKDDIHGWDWSSDQDSPFDSSGHGTHVAGIIGARGDNKIGISGISWKAELMNLKLGKIDTINDGIYYAVDNGAKVINMSLGWNLKISPEDYSNTSVDNRIKKHFIKSREAFQYAQDNDVVIVIAAGNEGGRSEGDLKYWDYVGNNDKYFSGWASLAKEFDNVISVGSIGANERMATYSNYGKNVDIAAPGGTSEVIYTRDPITGSLMTESSELDIFSTKPIYLHSSKSAVILVKHSSDELINSNIKENDLVDLIDLKTGDRIEEGVTADQLQLTEYQGLIGTSMATPLVAGSAALVWAHNPDLKASDVVRILLDSADKNPLIKPFVSKGRVLNLYSAMLEADASLTDSINYLSDPIA